MKEISIRRDLANVIAKSLYVGKSQAFMAASCIERVKNRNHSREPTIEYHNYSNKQNTIALIALIALIAIIVGQNDSNMNVTSSQCYQLDAEESIPSQQDGQAEMELG